MDDSSPPVEFIAPYEDEADRTEIPKILRSDTRCPVGRVDEIVVCARDQEHFRLRPLSGEFEKSDVPRPGFKLNETTSVGAELESGGVGGFPSNRVMVRGTIAF